MVKDVQHITYFITSVKWSQADLELAQTKARITYCQLRNSGYRRVATTSCIFDGAVGVTHTFEKDEPDDELH